MRCSNPHTTPTGQAFGCGQCLPCRMNKRRTWMHRILLESYQHEHNAFVTLTYADDENRHSLNPKHTQDWLHRLRKRIEPARVRYFLVGEYGDESQHAHYHAILFGFATCLYGQSQFNRRGNCCPQCDLVRDTWSLGNVFLGTVESDSAQYVAGYTVKKMTSKNDPRLDNRHPEFARMSLKPGIGYHALHEVASQLMKFNLETSQVDVPSTLRHGKKELPLGRYLQKNLRKLCGLPETTPSAVTQKVSEELLPLRQAAKDDPDNPSLKHQIKKANQQKLLQTETRNKIYKGKKSL